MTRLTASALLALALTGCSSSAPPPRAAPEPIDPVGMYDFVAALGTDERTGTLEFERIASGLRAEAWLTGESQPALSDSVVVNGSRVTFRAYVGGGDEVNFDLDFEGAAFRGVIVAGLDTITVRGQRR